MSTTPAGKRKEGAKRLRGGLAKKPVWRDFPEPMARERLLRGCRRGVGAYCSSPDGQVWHSASGLARDVRRQSATLSGIGTKNVYNV
jgi:hypothetical protein